MERRSTTIIVEDPINIKDKHTQKTKMIHDELFERYEINQEELFKKTGALKTIPPGWIPEIININIGSVQIPRTYYNPDKIGRSFTLAFDTSELCEKFYEKFNKNMPYSINSYITSQKQDPVKFNRIIIIETGIDGAKLTIRY